MMDSISKICATFFCIGYLPVAPGSITTIVGILISFALMGNPVVYAAVTLIVTVIGFVTSGRAEKAIGKKDPGCIVIDEVAGVMIACFLLPATLQVFWTVLKARVYGHHIPAPLLDHTHDHTTPPVAMR